MYFYHENYHDAYGTDPEELRSQDRRDDDLADEPIRIPAIVNWLVITGVALLVIVSAIDTLG